MGTLAGPGLRGGWHPGRLLGGGTDFISQGSGGRGGGDRGGCLPASGQGGRSLPLHVYLPPSPAHGW